MLALSGCPLMHAAERRLDNSLGVWYYNNFIKIYAAARDGDVFTMELKLIELLGEANSMEMKAYTQVPTITFILNNWKKSEKNTDYKEQMKKIIMNILEYNALKTVENKLQTDKDTISLLCYYDLSDCVPSLIDHIKAITTEDVKAIVAITCSKTRSQCLDILTARKLLTTEQEKLIQDCNTAIKPEKTSKS